MANLGLLMFLFIFIYALIGMQFFAGDFYDEDGGLLRANFNSFPNSLITVFILLTAENWNSVLMVFVDYFGFSCSLYFVSAIIFGNIMLLNLFLAILMNSVSSGDEDDNKSTMSDVSSMRKMSEGSHALGQSQSNVLPFSPKSELRIIESLEME